ncbi:MAG: CHAT domain-containing protein [Ignavibacteriales bacterium]|nr:CHAT domain-containing protein [Ignavibacteria bacterium]MBZ0197721.1 CHAT domain-containing protein [Ignavibacteriaceae bacterium]MCZ2141851.1 CHAT domain-containing protein [Ignavibacteriales bacterium]WKZ73878.1 MAG: CHAT domain-containing protein [Ignavibacteriaceae bacterium]
MKHHFIVFTLGILFLSSFSVKVYAQNDSILAMQYYALGINTYNEQNYDSSIIYFEKTLIYAKNYDFGADIGLVHFYLAEAYQVLGNYDESRKNYKAAIRIFSPTEFYYELGLAFRGIGDLENKNSNYKDAEKYYYSALEALAHDELSSLDGYIYINLANIVLNRGDNSGAKVLFKKAEEICDSVGFGPGLGDIYYGYGLIELNINNNPAADSLFDVALKLFTKFNIEMGVGNAWYGKGVAAMNQGENKKALNYGKKALKIYKANNYSQGVVNVLVNLGLISLNTADYETAENFLNEAIPWAKSANYLIGLGNIYKGFALIATNLAEHEVAINQYQLALEAYENADYTFGLASVYQGLSTIALNSGDNTKAEELAKLAIQYYEKTGFIIGIGQLYQNLASVFLNAGNYQKSREYYNKALVYHRNGQFPIGVGDCFYGLAQLEMIKNDTTSAKKLIDSSLVYYKRAEYPLGIGNSLFILANIAQTSSDYIACIDYLEGALNQFETVNYPFGIGRVCYTLGTVLHELDEYEEAERQFNAALNLFKLSDYNYFCSITAFGLANLYLDWKEKEKETIKYLDSAMYYLENFRANLVREEDRTNLFEKFSDYLNLSVYAAIYLGDNHSAFKFLENVKARSLADIMAERSANITAKVDPELLKQRTILEKQISTLKTRLNTSSNSEDDDIREELKTLNAKLDDLIFKIRTENPDFAALEYPKPADVSNVMAKLAEDEVALQYNISDYGAWVFVITKHNFEVVQLAKNPDEIREQTMTLLDGLRRNKYDVNKPADELDIEEEMSLEASEKLYSLLIKPVEKKLNKKSKLVIIPNDVLNFLPFEALYSDSLFLIERYPVKYYQSATLLALMRSSLKKERAKNGFAGFGDPVYDLDNYEKGLEERGVPLLKIGSTINSELAANPAAVDTLLSRAGLTLFRLRGTGEEIKGIADIFKKKGEPVNIKLRTEATEENAKDPILKNYRFLSFACHGIVFPGFQSLALCTEKDSGKSTQDGYLTFEEILGLDWNAKLVVLSACQTGTGDTRKTEGVIGLTRAVMYAGTDAVLVSLWSVSDAGTRDLMLKFFSDVADNKLPTDECLRNAKLALIKKGAAPNVWSPFILFGE